MEIYIFCLCAVVFTALTVLLTWLIAAYVRYYLRSVRLGGEDISIRKEFESEQEQNPGLNALGTILNVIICVVLIVVFAFSVSVSIDEKRNDTAARSGVLRVVKTNSMAKAYEKNEYLFQNGLEEEKYRFNTFDLIYTDVLPKEGDLKLYDVVVYDLDGYLVIHRIVKIEEPNEKHPDEYYYYFRGDNNVVSDPKPVKYSQMRGIWRGEKIPNVGSFVLFMQSPAGFLCILLMLFVVIALPIVTKKVDKAHAARYQVILENDANEQHRAAMKERDRKRMEAMQTYYNRQGAYYTEPYPGGYSAETPTAADTSGDVSVPQFQQITFTVDYTPPHGGK